MAALGLLGVVLVALLAFGAALEVQSDGQEEFMVSVQDERPDGDLTPDLEDAATEGEDSAPGRSRRAACGVPYKLSKSDRRAVLKAHNLVRMREGAANMQKLKWSSVLARRAQQWASQCKWMHGLIENCNGAPLGQNLFIAIQHQGFPNVNVTNVVDNGWWAEKKFFTFGNLKCQPKKMCGHYKQAVWAKSSHVGCSVARCPVVTEGMPKPWRNAVIFACDYDPAGNYLGQKPYVKGRPCSRCGDSLLSHGYKCIKKLCAPCDPLKTEGCKCIYRKCKNGVFKRNICKCACPKGFWGLHCEHKCKCEDTEDFKGQCKLVTGANMCNSPKYRVWIQSRCKKSCPNTCPRPSRNDPDCKVLV